MITNDEIKEIRTYLKKSENPLFFYDDDPDGLCSFLLLRKYIDKGKGVVLKSSPVLDMKYLRKVDEYKPDMIFILDKPIVSQEFIDKVNVPVIYIDHHPLLDLKGVHYYNPRRDDKTDNRPTSYWCYKITEQDLWIGTIGSVADWYIPEYIDQFMKEYKGILKNKPKSAPEVVYTGDFGKIVKMFAFILKNSITEVNKAVSVLLKIEDPFELLEGETSRSKFLIRIANKVQKKYDLLLEEAIENVKEDDPLLVYHYTYAKTALGSELSNELMIKYPEKIIIVARDKNDLVVMSVRSTKYKVIKPLEETLKNFNDSHGGGHDNACGAVVRKEDFIRFIEEFRNNIG